MSTKGKKFSLEHRDKLSRIKKEQGIKPPSRLGIKHTIETKMKMSKSSSKFKLENRKKQSEIMKKLWREGRFKNAKFRYPSGKDSKKYGGHLSEETKRKISLSHGGTGIPQRPTKRYYHLRDCKYKEWRSKVFERDNWTCQTCGKRGVYLEPHHIKGWAKYPELRYEVENGVALCIECHKLTRKKY